MMINTINICGIPFKVAEVEEIPADYKGEIVQGEISHSNADIKIRASMPKDLKHQALLHEWVHGALVMIGYNELSSDEVFVQNLALAINQTFEIRSTKRSDEE